MSLACIIPLGPGEPVPVALIEDLASTPIPLILSATTHTASLPAHAKRLQWLQGPAGRAQQLNHGIASCNADWLWLVHADSQLSAFASDAVLSFCSKANWQKIGYGQLRFANDGPKPVVINQWAANLRSALFGQPYGDQGLCIHRTLWERLGGFSQRLERGEDLDFVIRARTLGAKTQRLPFAITTSARRYRAHGWLRTTIDHQWSALELIQQAKRWRP